MTDNIRKMLDYFVVEKRHHDFRQKPTDKYRYAKIYSSEHLSDIQRSVRRLSDVLKEETPVVFQEDRIALLRTVTTLPEIFTEQEEKDIHEKHYTHELGKVCNINPEYMLLVKNGFDEKREEIKKSIQNYEAQKDNDRIEYLKELLSVLDTIEEFCGRYREKASEVGNTVVSDVLSRIPKKAPETLLEALQFLRIVHYCLWCSFNYHNTLGRFDQYMYPYYEHDIKAGILNKGSALELVEEFFISLNKDSDLYPGMQQGDNGQSIVLGGLNPDGTESYNEFSDLCLQASLELKLIDPKINLRVNKNTPVELYVKGTELTKQGLGFPQYSNDDIVIPALMNWGYEKADAYNYAIAACWEFIIPGRGMDIPNINSVSMPKCVMKAVNNLHAYKTYEDFSAAVRDNIFAESREIASGIHDLYMEPAPLMSLLMEDCVETAKDISLGNRYNNFGFHGTGISTAVDSMASIRKFIYDEKSITVDHLLEALHTNFEHDEELCNKLRYEGPKMGNDDDSVDDIAKNIVDWFADSLKGLVNERGGIFRAGTGSAMYYIWQAKDAEATPDGRRKGEGFSANYSPSLFTRLRGPVSIIKSFAKPDLKKVCNGGPLTIELSDTMFRNRESVEKTARFVRTFMILGGHQLQINAVNREKMLDAKKHPENYRNLIVRVWGWSGYFVELDECYQDHIIKRMELSV